MISSTVTISTAILMRRYPMLSFSAIVPPVELTFSRTSEIGLLLLPDSDLSDGASGQFLGGHYACEHKSSEDD